MLSLEERGIRLIMINVVFCIPGKTFSQHFLHSWTGLLYNLFSYNVESVLNGAVSSNVYIARNSCLIEDQTIHIHQKPFDGKLNYDYIMWIDSDSVFVPEQFKALLDQMEKNPKLHILSGLYLKDFGEEYSTVVTLGDNYIKRHGHPKFLTPADILRKSKLIKVAYTGLGFMMVRRGVFESLTYPWFQPLIMKNGINISGFASEDASFCLRAKKAGFDTFVDPKIIIGHEKSRVWR